MVAQEEVLAKVVWEISVRDKQNISLLTVPLCPLGNQTKVEKWLAV